VPHARPGVPGIAAPSYGPEGDTGAAQQRPQTTTEALTAAYRLCATEGVPAPGHRRMVRLVKDHLSSRGRIEASFVGRVMAYRDPTADEAIKKVLREARR
jgi:hypothetical protein